MIPEDFDKFQSITKAPIIYNGQMLPTQTCLLSDLILHGHAGLILPNFSSQSISCMVMTNTLKIYKQPKSKGLAPDRCIDVL